MRDTNRKAKRNNYTLTKEAQSVIDKVPSKQKSKFVSDAIVKQQPPLLS